MLAGRRSPQPGTELPVSFIDLKVNALCYYCRVVSTAHTHRHTPTTAEELCAPPSCVQSKPANPNSERKMRLIILQRSTVRFSPPQFSAVRWKKNFSRGVGSPLCHFPAFCLLVVSNVRLILLSCLLFKIFIFSVCVCVFVRGSRSCTCKVAAVYLE